MEGRYNLGPHYDKTLMAWNRNFQLVWQIVMTKYLVGRPNPGAGFNGFLKATKHRFFIDTANEYV